MKFHFEPNLDFQLQAIEAVCDLFRGQEICRTEFTVTRDALAVQLPLTFGPSDLGIGNRLKLLNEEILANLSDIQLRNGLRPSTALASDDFTVEMETGTWRGTPLNNSVSYGGEGGTFVQRQLLVNRAPVLTLWAVVGEVLGGQRTAPEDAQRRKSDR